MSSLALASGPVAAQTDPPARVASLSHIEGSVAFVPAGESEWTDAQLNRPVTGGDRLRTDPGARAELHLGSAVLQMDSQTALDINALDDAAFQASLTEGSLNARVRQIDAGQNFEIDTPQLAFRTTQAGEARIDVDPAQGITRITVRSGAAVVYGASGQASAIQAGQQIVFAGRDLAPLAAQAAPMEDEFDRWAQARNRSEDQSLAARYVPRDVVGYAQLDPYGNWAEDPSYGVIWYPRVTVVNWAPYRDGHWEWIVPWGWTWIDNAPWGFAPFHYGRWALIGARWAWVPGRIGRHPTYAPALVTFVGASRGASAGFSIGSSPGIAWFPLAPGEAWRPAFHASPGYWRNVNRDIVVKSSAPAGYVYQQHPAALTALKIEDFRSGRPVQRHWSRVNPSELARAPVAAPFTLPEPQRPRVARPPANDARASAQPAPQEEFIRRRAPSPHPDRAWHGPERLPGEASTQPMPHSRALPESPAQIGSTAPRPAPNAPQAQVTPQRPPVAAPAPGAGMAAQPAAGPGHGNARGRAAEPRLSPGSSPRGGHPQEGDDHGRGRGLAGKIS